MRLALVTIALMGSLAAAITWMPNTPLDDRLAVVTDVGTGGIARLEPPASVAPAHTGATPYRVFGFPMVFAGANTERKVEAPPRVADRPLPRPATPIASPATVTTASVVITPPRPVLAQRPRSLTLAIQTELRRLGCYTGDVDGEWGPASRRGLRAFMEEVGATLPTSEPDRVTLTLLRGHTGQLCGTQCPTSRIPPTTGGCQNGPTVASRTIRQTVEHASRSSPSGEPITGADTASGRRDVSMTGISVQPVAATPGTTSSSWVTTTTIDTQPVLVQGPSRIADPRNTPPLEGRMAIGGPMSVVTPVAEPQSPGTAQVPLASTGEHPTTQPPPRQSNRSWKTSRRNTSWTATFFDR